MRMTALAGALALAAIGATPVGAEPADHRTVRQSGGALTDGQIAMAKSALRLRPDQERRWGRVAAALRALPDSAAANAVSARAIDRVVEAAQPLVRTLDPEQRETARRLVRALGYGHLAARL